jgi:mRNA interferase MazF
MLKMLVKKWFVYTADLNPPHKAEPGKVRPVVVVQTDLLNSTHPTTIICPLTTNVQPQAEMLRVHLKSHEAGLRELSDILVDQIRAIDTSRLKKELGPVNADTARRLKLCIETLLD